jgi:hypothetical protein
VGAVLDSSEGEFFYRNGIDFTAPGFLRVTAAPAVPGPGPTGTASPAGPAPAAGGTSPLVMFSGGKDSLALTYALKDGPVDFFLYNPTAAQRALAGSLADGGRVTEVHRAMLPELLEMNDSGEFPNGHWEKEPDPSRPLAPGRVRRGFRNIRRELGTPARVAKPSRPGPGRPKGSSKGPAPRHLLPGEADMPRTAKPALTSKKVKT